MGNQIGGPLARFGHRVLYGPAANHMTEDELWEYRARIAKPIPILAHKARTFEPDDNVRGQEWKTMNILSAGLGFDVQVINQLYSLFCIADLDNSGMIDVYEFLVFFDLENSPFNRRMFGVFDMDASGEIDFLEFACAIWNLCTWPVARLPALMFCVYDQDNSGQLDLKECEDLVMDVYAQRKVRTGAGLLIDSLRGVATPGLYKGDILVKEKDFVAWADEHPESYFPLKCQWLLLRNKVLGAEEAVRLSLEKAADFRAGEMQRKQQEKMWEAEDEQETGAIDEETTDLKALARAEDALEDENALQERLKAVSYLRVARNKRYKEWYKTLSKIEERSDPLSMLMRFSKRDLAHTLRKEFDEAWTRAMSELQRRTYDREGRLRRLVGHKKGKEDLYFVRKNPLSLSEEELRDSRVRYSTSDGKLTWAEQQHEAHKRRKREFRHAGGNAHLAHGVLSKEKLLESKERVRRDQAEMRRFIGLEEDEDEGEEDTESDEDNKDTRKHIKGGAIVTSALAKDDQDYDTDDEEAEREARTEELQRRRRSDLIRQGYANAPASSRRVAAPGQGSIQDLAKNHFDHGKGAV
ncbi:Calcineurin subunit B [Hondaea fermentalgiana]|uniref:Calcineurin subunit B n=1 Tax=Hondaea fermentalgiana TaxID=2315210 RepID=A0A2R5GC34_9STRA|nr:Calcineurin subunit B [Hondaea fermentalgiana]|eukprot:GBG28115.1 Calcineurin subunit B [Hondaea fermentalgiana]